MCDAIRQFFQQRKAAAQMIDRLDVRCALCRPLAGLSPVDDGQLNNAGFRIVICEKLGLCLQPSRGTASRALRRRSGAETCDSL
jgi:hypothetical protein